MQNLRNPKWLFFINTLPITVVFFLFIGEYNIIKSLLNEENNCLWLAFGLTLGILGLLNFGYALWLTIKKRQVSAWYSIAALLSYISFIYLFGFHTDKIIPLSIPQWMVSGNNLVYVGTFLMPTLVYSLLVLVAHFTPEATEQSPWKNFLIAFVIPVSWYAFSQIIFPLWQPLDAKYVFHFILISTIIGTLLLLFFLIRGLLIIVTKKAAIWQKYQLAWKIPISLVLPLLGLCVNNGLFFTSFNSHSSGIFGDFNSYWFYLLALLNGLFICLPNRDNPRYRILLFIGRSITFSYTFYFFIVFLPFLPISIIALVAIGVGFLMLAPLLLFVLHINELTKDFSYLKDYFSKKNIRTIIVAGFLILPIAVTIDYWIDRAVLNETLDYIYNPDYSKEYTINKASLHSTISTVKLHKDRNQDLLFLGHLPYLSSYFNWLVLDNLTLSDAKINTIEKIFFGSTSFELRPENIVNEGVTITNCTSKSTFDKSQNAWLSWIDLEITNNNEENPWLSEYTTTFELPEGAWISDYYLYVDDKKEYGILAEKKSALWVFSNIANLNKDPGILYYLTGNKVAFRVFPFAKAETRKTGIQILHKEPISFMVDKHLVQLGTANGVVNESNNTNENVVYVSTKLKQTLTKIHRKPYFHFLVDVSENKEKNNANFTERIEHVLVNNKSLATNAKISFINSYSKTVPLDKNWKDLYKSQVFDGGFYLDRGIKTALFKTYQNNSATYPVFVVVTDTIQNAVLDKDLADLSMTFPESNLFFNATENGRLQPHSLTSNPTEPIADTVYSFDNTVLEYTLAHKKCYLPNNNQPSIVLKKELFELTTENIKVKNWEAALNMQAKWNSQILHPETADKEWLNLVKYSFLSKIMTPVTSYLVVENEAQKAILKKKQKQVLSSNKSLDLGEDTQRMSEPSFLLMAVLLCLLLWYRQKKQPEKN